MFKFLKEKLKGSIKKISGKIDEEGATEEKIGEKPIEKEVTEKKPDEEKKGFFSKLKEKFSKKEEVEEKKEEEPKAEEKEEQIVEEKPVIKEKPKEKKRVKKEKKEEKIQPEVKKGEVKEEKTEKKGFFTTIKEKVTTKKIDQKKFNEIFWDLEMALLENNVAVEVIEKIKKDLGNDIIDRPLRRSKIEGIIADTLKKSIKELLDIESYGLLDKIKEKKPYVICFFGINGSGKTTTIAKIAQLLKNNNLSVVLVASDTWRQAAIEQLEEWAARLEVPIVKHSYGSDPAAVAYDGVAMAKARNIDVVLIDTAGRMHSNINLIEEMKKIVRIAKPDLKIFIGESLTGNDCTNQAKEFNESIGIDGIILSKADVDEKGGAALSVSYVTKKPIIYLGVGQQLDDLKEFDPSIVMNNIGLES